MLTDDYVRHLKGRAETESHSNASTYFKKPKRKLELDSTTLKSVIIEQVRNKYEYALVGRSSGFKLNEAAECYIQRFSLQKIASCEYPQDLH